MNSRRLIRTTLQLRRCRDAIVSQLTQHRFVASQWARMNDGWCSVDSAVAAPYREASWLEFTRFVVARDP
jgi:hypothetical protein